MKYIVVALLFSASLTGCTTIPENTSGRVVLHDKNAYVDIRFNDRDRHMIHDYYRKYKHKRVPPGLAKRGGNLPPGLAKRDRLPPGLQGRGLPHALESSLSPLPGGYVRRRVGKDIVLMDSRTRTVFDIIFDID